MPRKPKPISLVQEQRFDNTNLVFEPLVQNTPDDPAFRADDQELAQLAKQYGVEAATREAKLRGIKYNAKAVLIKQQAKTPKMRAGKQIKVGAQYTCSGVLWTLQWRDCERNTRRGELRPTCYC